VGRSDESDLYTSRIVDVASLIKHTSEGGFLCRAGGRGGGGDRPHTASLRKSVAQDHQRNDQEEERPNR
jgi:hypothetical protein